MHTSICHPLGLQFDVLAIVSEEMTFVHPGVSNFDRVSVLSVNQLESFIYAFKIYYFGILLQKPVFSTSSNIYPCVCLERQVAGMIYGNGKLMFIPVPSRL